MLENMLYVELVKQLRFGYALCRMIYSGGKAVDYEFVDLNPSFGKMFKVDYLKLIGRNISEIGREIAFLELPDIEQLNQVIGSGGSHDYIRYYDIFGKWYRITVFSDIKDHFVLFAADLSDTPEYSNRAKDQTHLSLPFGKLQHQVVSDKVMNLTGASFVLFYQFDKTKKCLVNKAVSGENESLQFAAELLGFEITRKEWELDTKVDGQFQGGRIIRFGSICELASGTVSESVLTVLEQIFNIGDAYMIEIINNCENIGFFLVFMEKGKTINHSYGSLELYIHQIGHTIIRENAENDLKESLVRMNTLLDHSSSGYLFTDSRLDILYINPMFCRMFEIDCPEAFIGVEGGELYKKVWNQIRNPEKFKSIFNSNLDWKKPLFNKEVTLTSGSVYSYNYLPILQNDSINGCLWEVRDITYSKHVKRVLKEAKDMAESANAAKSKFLAYMSHELRTPIHCIVGFLDLLKNTPLEAKQQEYINYIQASSELLLGVVNNILDFSKIESGKLELEYLNFNIKSTVKEVLSNLSIQTKGKDLKIMTCFDDSLPEEVEGDAVKFRQIITNLVANAIKFTQKGWIKTEVIVLEQTEKDVSIQVNVEDTGIGLSEEDSKKIFEPFSQADASTSRIFGGTGLGLAICKNMIELMGGNMWADGKPGEGSVFSFAIALKKSTGHTDQREQAALDPAAIVGISAWEKNILLAEDSDITRELFVNILKLNGYSCDVARCGEEVVRACMEKEYDIVFMDCQMPVMDGYEATRRIREQEAGSRHTFIIALTANAMKNELDKCLECGMDDYICKPVKSSEVIRILKKRIGDSDAVANCTHSIVSRLVRETGIEKSDCLDLLEKYFMQAGIDKQKLEKKIGKKKWKSAERILHKFKGLSMCMGALDIAESVIGAEDALKAGKHAEFNRRMEDVWKKVQNCRNDFQTIHREESS